MGQHRPTGTDQRPVICSWLGESRRKGLLEAEPHSQQDCSHQDVLGREVVHDRAVGDPEALGHPPEAHPAETLGGGHGDGRGEDLVLIVLGSHRVVDRSGCYH